MLHLARHALAAAVVTLMPSGLFAYDTAAREVLVIDYDTGAVLLEKNADMAVPPASMSKLMTLNMLFEALEEDRFDLSDTFTVSETAWRKGGSTMFLEPRHRPTVEDLIRGIIVHSGNDACIVVAENLAGSEAAFAAQMTARGREIGLTASNFANATGWPDPTHRMSIRDLVVLGERMIRDFPDHYPYFAESEYSWQGISQPNRNPLLTAGVGGDGLKTGHTEEAGFGLVGSAMQEGRRIVFAVNGLASSSARAIETEQITRWAFREFENATLFEAGAQVAEAPVWIGASENVPLVTAEDIIATIPRGSLADISALAVFDGPLSAPVAAGAQVGHLSITIPNMPPLEVPLLAANDVAEAGFFSRFGAAAGLLANDAMSYAFGADG
ncbi:MAG: D-alanyl-D-alanine carboxypeptidase family protein [Pseudomonadota bacterium]